MTSLFESDFADGAPADLLGDGRRGVALLEFMAIGAKAAAGTTIGIEDTPGEDGVEDERAVQMRSMLDAARGRCNP